jgi:uncharacterized protein (TIGR03083 family)
MPTTTDIITTSTTTTDISTEPAGALDEVGAIFTTLLQVPADAPTACAGWTAHELTAHLAAGAVEEAELIDAHLDGRPSRPTRPFAEREAPYRAMDDDDLRATLVEQGARLGELIDRLRAHGDADAVLFTGRPMTAADFAMHSRSECALHRWDLVGSDDVSRALLAQPALTAHALKVLGSMDLPEAPAVRARAVALGDAPVRIVLRSAPADDLVVTATGSTVTLALEAATDDPPTLEIDAADRLLLLWGRRPTGADRWRARGDVEQRALAHALFRVS